MSNSSLRRHILNFCKDTRAATVVEFAFVAPLYLGLMFGILEAALTMMALTSMDFGLQLATQVIQRELQRGALANNQTAILNRARAIMRAQPFCLASVQIGSTPSVGAIVIYNRNPLVQLSHYSSPRPAVNLIVLRAVYRRAYPGFIRTLLGTSIMEAQSSAAAVVDL